MVEPLLEPHPPRKHVQAVEHDNDDHHLEGLFENILRGSGAGAVGDDGTPGCASAVEKPSPPLSHVNHCSSNGTDRLSTAHAG